MHCKHIYENGRDFKTSICSECFKRFNEDTLQPLRDIIHTLAYENAQLKKAIKELELRS